MRLSLQKAVRATMASPAYGRYGASVFAGVTYRAQQWGSSEPEFNRIFALCLHWEELAFVFSFRMAGRSAKRDHAVR
jgi:hypothetical protein